MTENRLLTPEEYTKHLRDYCHLKPDEIEVVLNNVYKRINREQVLEKNAKKKGRL
jgi:hypothetical protein